MAAVSSNQVASPADTGHAVTWECVRNGLHEAGKCSRCLFSLSGLTSTAVFLTKPGVSSKAFSGTLFFIVGRKRSLGEAVLARGSRSRSAGATWGQGRDPYLDIVLPLCPSLHQVSLQRQTKAREVQVSVRIPMFVLASV